MKTESFYTVKDIMEKFGVSQITVYRWVALARQGKHWLPLPIGDRNQTLRWSQESFANLKPRAPPEIESASQRTKRHNAALERLRSRGVKIAPTQEEQK
jgi:transposase-like protein